MTIYLQNANGTKESFYLDRFKRCLYGNNGYDSEIGSFRFTHWFNSGRLQFAHKVILSDITFYEEEYKGEHLIVVGWHYDLQELWDHNGKQFENHYDLDDSKIGRYGEKQRRSSYAIYSWEIGSHFDSIKDMAFLAQLCNLKGICSSNSQEKTLKAGKKKIDLLAKIREAKADLIAVADENLYGSERANPYNAEIGDMPFIQAFGRLRKGKIVQTSGSRFIVAYVTPSNHRDLKYKTLPLSQLWVKA